MFLIAPSAQLVVQNGSADELGMPALTDGSGARISFLSPERVEISAAPTWLAPRELSLHWRGEAALRVPVKAWAHGPGERRVGTLAPLDIAEARSVIRLSTTVTRPKAGVFAMEHIMDPTRVKRALVSLANARADGFLTTSRQTTVSLVAFLEPSNDALLFSTSGDMLETDVVEVELVGSLSLFKMTLRVTYSSRGFFSAELPTQIVRTRRRKWLRGELTGTHLLVRHPWFENDMIRVGAKDVSRGGLGLQGEIETLLLYPGLHLPEIEVWRGDRRVDGPYRGEVRHTTQSSAGTTVSAFQNAASVSSLSYPRTTLDPSPVSDVWDLLVEAGYLRLGGRTADELSVARENFLSTLRHFHAAPSVGVVAGWRSAGSFDGTVTMVRLYSSAWMAYHLAKVSGPSASGLPGKLVLRDFLRHAYEHVLAQDETQFLLSYVRDDAGWPKLLNTEFAQRHALDGHTFTESEHAYLLACADLTDKTASLQPIEDVTGFIAAARRRHGDAFCDAYDYRQDELELSSVAARWRGAGLARERSCFEWRSTSGERAFAVAELASPGTHLYGLFDCVRIYHTGEHNPEAEAALLDTVAVWFRAAGRTAFAFFQQDGVAAPVRPAKDMGRFSASLIPVSIAPDYLEHLSEITSAQVRV